mmetsp:Transcript_20650/g.25042  ORF Transcript_20650/g.25042 Transcript_20650/m.25042 type:complete len:96 (-) Transcript_20650:265-552(-)
MTSDHNPFRLLNVEILGKISTPDETQKQQTVFSQNIQVANTKERSIYIFKVDQILLSTFPKNPNCRHLKMRYVHRYIHLSVLATFTDSNITISSR